MNCVLDQAGWLSVVQPPSYLLVPRNASVDSGINDTVETHAQQVDVAMHLFVLILADQRAELLVLILNYLDGILQRAHLHLWAHTESSQG